MHFEKISREQWQADTHERDVIEYKAIELPQRATAASAGYDFHSTVECALMPGKTLVIPTGIRACLEDDQVLSIYPRSSLGIKHGIEIANTVGVIDADYQNGDNEGHIFIALRCVGDAPYMVSAGERIAQGVITSYIIADNDTASGVRTGGIGSTGTK